MVENVVLLSKFSGRALAAQARCLGFDSQRLPVHFPLFCFITSKISSFPLYSVWAYHSHLPENNDLQQPSKIFMEGGVQGNHFVP